jgi:hypothetical protein
MNQDEEHLRLLTTFHYVLAGVAGLFSLFPVIHLTLGLFLVFAPEKFTGSGHGQPPPAFMGWLFVGLAAFMIVCGLTFACLVLAAGRCLAKRKAYTFCFVMGCVECLFMPFGTVLGIFTIMVLNRSGVRGIFGKVER